jgi:DNA-directed RNA polymerase specialized sigma24 family protein
LNEAPSFEEFVGARADAQMRYAYVLTGDPHDATDLLQESLIRVRAAWHGIVNKREPEVTCVPRWRGCTSVSGAYGGANA